MQEVMSEMETSRKRNRDEACEEEDDVGSHKRLKLMVKKGRWDLETNRQTMQKLVARNAEIRDDLIAEMEEDMDNLQETLKKQSMEVESLNLVLKEKRNLITNLDLRQKNEMKKLVKLVCETENKVQAMVEFEENFKRKHPDLVEFFETMKTQQQKIDKMEALLSAKNMGKKKLAAMEESVKIAPKFDLKRVLNGLNVTISSASEENVNNGANPKVTITKDKDNLYKTETKKKSLNLDVDNHLLNNTREKRTKDISLEEPVPKTVFHIRKESNDGTKNEGASAHQNKTKESLDILKSCTSCILGKVHICLEDDCLDEEELPEY